MARKIKLTPSTVTRILSAAVALLLMANLVSIYFKFVREESTSFFKTFYFNGETNLPSFYSFVTLLISAGLFFLIGTEPSEGLRRGRYFWKALSYIFVFLAIDEFISIHETFSDDGEAMLGGHATGFFHFAWVVPYLLLAVVVGLLLIKPFLTLPRKIQWSFALAGILFFLGAAGFEMISGKFVSDHAADGTNTLTYAILVTIEELLEMIAIIILIRSLTGYYISIVDKNRVNFKVCLRRDNLGTAPIAEQPPL